MSQSNSARSPDGVRAKTTLNPSSATALIPIVRVRWQDGLATFIPPAGIGLAAIEHPLPQIPKSLIDQLIASCRWFWQRHRRCVGFVLIWKPDCGPWAAMIPAQRCSDDSACWSALVRDLPDLKSSSLMMGSFQSRVLGNGETATDCPPPNDGVHFVFEVEPDRPRLSTLLRCESQNHPVPTSSQLCDDFEAMFDSAMDRMIFT